MYFVDERFGYGTIEEYTRRDRQRAGVLRGTFYRSYVKRACDLVAALLGLAVLSPFFLVIAVIIAREGWASLQASRTPEPIAPG